MNEYNGEAFILVQPCAVCNLMTTTASCTTKAQKVTSFKNGKIAEYQELYVVHKDCKDYQPNEFSEDDNNGV